MPATTLAVCDHAHGECLASDDYPASGDDATHADCTVEQLARLGEGTHPANLETLEKRFAARLRGRYERINATLRTLIQERDILGLGADTPSPPDIQASEREREGGGVVGGRARPRAGREQLARPPTNRETAHRPSWERHDVVIEWLEDEQAESVVGVIVDREGRFIDRAYDRGARNGRTFIRRSSVDPIPGVDLTEHGVDEQRAIRRLYTRAREDTRGIGADVSREVSREITAAYAQGLSPTQASRNITSRVDAVGKHQSTVLSRTLLMEAHNEAAATTYEKAGVERVEILTASDACEACEALTGRSWHPRDAHTVVPGQTHPQCRCTIVPVAA